jgi:hypothetical protein
MVTFNKHICGLTGWCFKMPNAPYSNRWRAIKNARWAHFCVICYIANQNTIKPVTNMALQNVL